MIWAIIGIVILGLLLDSEIGKFAVAAALLAAAFFIIRWITDWEIFASFAKFGATAAIVIIVGLIIVFIFKD